MKYINDKNNEIIRSYRSNRKLWQRVLSFVTVLALVTNTMYTGGLLKYVDFTAILRAESAGEVPSYTTDNDASSYGSDIGFDDTGAGIKKFLDYCYYFYTDDTFAWAHKNDKLNILFTNIPDNNGFVGLGNENVPFEGSIVLVATNLSLPRALFNNVSTDVKVIDANNQPITLKMAKNSSASSPLFADHVHVGTNTADWKINVVSTNTNDFAGVIGQLEENASVDLEFKNESSASVANTASGDNEIKDVGELCGIMKNGSSLTVNDTSVSRPDVSSVSGNAGSLVGTMEGNASLTLTSYPAFDNSVTSENGFAGGLVGVSGTSASITGLASPLAVSGTITGKTGAGGLYGQYTNSAAEFDLKDHNITASVSADNCGGVFGVLINNKGDTAASLTIKNTGSAGNVDVSTANTATTGYFGGIIGKYVTDDLKNSLILDGLTISAASNAPFDHFGGAIGVVDDAAYIKADGLTITASGTAKKDTIAYFGGLIGKTSDEKGVFADIGSFKLTASDGFNGGGAVGYFKNGVLRLSGITDMSEAKSNKGGQLIGENDNVLVYALGTGIDGTAYENGWTFRRSNGSLADDIGTWGEVVRISDIEDTANGILTLDTTEHTVTVKPARTSMGTKADFAVTALNIQLNNGADYDCLKFTAGDNNKRDTLLDSTLTVTNDISLEGTGISGFMRDGSVSVGNFTGTLNGGDKTVTLAVGEKYGKTSDGTDITTSSVGEGLGQIYAHPYNGLFAVIGNGADGEGKVDSIRIAGSMNVRNTIDGMNIGGIAAVSQGSTSLRNIIAQQTVNYGEPDPVNGSESNGKNIGGVIGIANAPDNGTIAVTGTNTISTAFNISNNFKSWDTLGALIGKVTSHKFTIDIAQGASDKLTVAHTMVDGGFTAGTNADGGGLIGYITSGTKYSDRKVNIDNLYIDGCKVINKASANGGGLLGYAWLDTDTTIGGIEVTNAAITNSSPNVGVMCYAATGRWQVNDLKVDKLSLSGGAEASIGMLVNKAYEGNKGLYLDVLRSGYILTDKSSDTGITLPDTLSVYDEIAAYSANNVVKGSYTEGNNTYGAGVISINMNAARNSGSALITSTGTYQDQLVSASAALADAAGYPNANSRYYYDLDMMNSSDAGQNIVLWSVNKYASANIRGLFVSTVNNNTLSGNADMTGLSFYPIECKENCNISGLTLTMDHMGVYGAESVSNTDGYIRDAGDVTNKNQHYLMQSGLFTYLSNTKTLTISGNNTLKGTFLEVDGVSGVLISGTSNGSIVSASGSTLKLDGISPKTTANASYDGGYLLVNNITRVNSINSADDITIRLEGISTTDYSQGVTVAKSLLGAASGNDLNIEFTKIKLDSRKSGTLSSNNALDDAYGTKSAIFTDATLLASIKTNDKAQLKYYYTIEEDWGTNGTNGTRWVTYGKEIIDSKEYRENNISQESKYDGSSYYTHPTTYQSGSSYNDFSTDFLPYVAVEFTEAKSNELYFRELRVNVSAEGLTKGCGTYNDPYIITDGKQLVAVSRFIYNGTTNELSKVQLPKDKGSYDSISENTVGSRWCTDKDGETFHALFTPDGDTNYKNGDILWNKTNVQYYLANAYYKVENNIDLSGDNATGFVGLGGNTPNTAFRGVIVGETKSETDSTPEYTIKNNSKYPFINISNGCVVKDINIEVGSDISLDQGTNGYNNAYFGYASWCKYYGGIMGEIMGGDNIIDNSYVKFANGKKVTLSGTNGTIVPVGGYVGVVVFGGLIFKNMDARTVSSTGLNVIYSNGNTQTTNGVNLANSTDSTVQESWAAIYVNPIVGRVINGYAVNETGGNALNAKGEKVQQFSVTEDGHYHDDANTERSGIKHTLKNGKKHYSIADINKSETEKLDVTAIPSSSGDGNINVPNAQALFVLSLITQSGAGTATDNDLGDYNNSLSYGTYSDTIFGMSHDASYSDVGTDEATSNDYSDYVCFDTADKKALPYIVKHYTIGETVTGSVTEYEEKTIEWDETVLDEEYDYSKVQFTGDSIPNGSKFVIKGTRSTGDYVTSELWSSTTEYVNKRNSVLYSTNKIKQAEDDLSLDDTKLKNATEFYFEQTAPNATDYYIYYIEKDENNNEQRKYLTVTEVTQVGGKWPDNDHALRGNYEFGITPITSFTLQKSNNYWQIKDSKFTMNYSGDNTNFCAWTKTDAGSILALYTKTVTQRSHIEHHSETEYIPHTSIVTTNNYPARCVTSTLGHYNINLTSGVSYQLPDSFRGLGCVGNNNTAYEIKLDRFDGKGCMIDEDIYLNKFQSDNYLNVIHNAVTQSTNTGSAYGVNKEQDHHGIGLFDSIKTKGEDSKLTNFKVGGSVNTEIYNNTYSETAQEQTIYGNDKARFISVGGVCGSTNATEAYLTFDNIELRSLSVCGSCIVGGLLGYSNNQSKTIIVKVNECRATDLSIKLNSSSAQEDIVKPRNAMGGFVGKCVEGAVEIHGNTTTLSSVTLKSFGYETLSGVTDHRTVAGGLVGFAGNGCRIYDMTLSPSAGHEVTIGSDYTGYAGGLVGLMQPFNKGEKTCVSVYQNCTVEKINVNGHYAGGFYGGKWINDYSPYSITLDNCNMVGDTSTNNTIKGNSLRNENGYAGGFLGCGNVYASGDPNITIKDCKVSHYNITSTVGTNGDKGYVGGFIGFTGSYEADSSITCYIYDSSVENCVIGTDNNYAGGAIGKVERKSDKSDNKLLGYNIKLDHVTSQSSRMGAWIGYVDSKDDSTSIQFAGLGIYGNGFTRNVGNIENFERASFVFADYSGACGGSIPEGKTEIVYPTKVSEFDASNNVEMPRYPYVNINPQMSVCNGKIISGDGAVLSGTASSASEYSGKTAEKTMALKIYEDTQLTDTSAANYSRRYTTFGTFNGTDDAKINGGNKIDHYMKRTVSDDGDRISNYYAEKGISTADYDNFACVVIANNTTNETTDLINRYAQLVTNTSTDYAGTDAANDYFDIKVASCKLKDGGFAIDTGKAGLKYENGKFSLDPSAADSLSATDTFTLVDIQFKDPFNKDKVAYHLYIPVYTIKEIEVTFYAAVMNGTNSVSYKADGTENENVYSTKLNKETSDTHVENLDTWYTTYIRYEYGEDDLNALLDSGDLNWNHNKYFYIDKTKHDTTYVLPESTYMILVDPNGNSDKQYQILLNNNDFTRQNVTSTTGRITFDLTKFKDSEGNNFSVSTFNEMIAKDIEAVEKPQHDGKYNLYSGSGTPSNTGKKYYVFTESENKTITYYEYVGSGGTHDLSLPEGYVLNESYYISMYVPTLSDSDPLYGYYIRTPEMFDAPVYESGTNNAITKSAKIKCHYISGNENNGNTQNRQVYIGTLFEQDTKLTVLTNDPEIDTGNRTLNIYVESTIRPKDNNVKTILGVVNTDIYHSFNVYLDRKGENGSITNTIYGLDGDEDGVPRIKAWYSIGEAMPKDIDADLTGFTAVDADSIDLQDNYINICTVDGGQEIMKDDGVTVYSRISMKFDNAYLKQQFPQKVLSDTGVSVRAASTLAYDAASLAFSSMSESAEEPSATKHIFYRQSMDSASLNYFAEPESDCFDLDGAPSENLSRLGISGKYSMNEYMPVNTTAKYNISNIESAAESAEKLSVTLSLQKKTDTPTEGTYTAVNYADVTSIDKYWGAVKRDAQTHEVEPDEAGKPVTDAGKTNLYIKCGNYENIVPVPSNAKTLSFEIPKDAVGTAGFIIDENGYININIGFSAKTGENFTEYANYRVNLSMRLLDGSNTDVGGSYADDYLIYTNAKVNHDFLTGN